MNKTVNINIVNILFHIDEDAYQKIYHYLEAIKSSFSNTTGSDEIITDIEARIAEILQEKLKNERQVVTLKEIDEIITIMGQPEDYMVDEDIFEDEPNTFKSAAQKRVKKLFRDTASRHIAGVSSGLAHYIGLEPIWIRLSWVFLTLFSGGGFIFLYILLWILIPEAKTTADRLDMHGEEININNIEKKVQEGFSDVTEKVKNGSRNFFDTFGDLIIMFFKILGKFIGVILVVIGATAIIGLFISLISTGIIGQIYIPGIDPFSTHTEMIPTWLLCIFLFFLVAIPFFFLIYLGLKILITNLKSIANITKYTLLGLWLISLAAIITVGIKEAATYAYSGNISIKQEIQLKNPNNTLQIIIPQTDLFSKKKNKFQLNDMVIYEDDNGNRKLASKDVFFRIKKSTDSILRVEVIKKAKGASIDQAKEIADNINYHYSIKRNTLIFDNFSILDAKNSYKHQGVRINIYVPENMFINYHQNNYKCWKLKAANEHHMNGCNISKHLWKMNVDGELKCQDCYSKTTKNHHNQKNINTKGININIDDDGGKGNIKIDGTGIDIDVNDNRDSFKMKIDENGIKINTREI